jgi:hypothetical protein
MHIPKSFYGAGKADAFFSAYFGILGYGQAFAGLALPWATL